MPLPIEIPGMKFPTIEAVNDSMPGVHFRERFRIWSGDTLIASVRMFGSYSGFLFSADAEILLSDPDRVGSGETPGIWTIPKDMRERDLLVESIAQISQPRPPSLSDSDATLVHFTFCEILQVLCRKNHTSFRAKEVYEVLESIPEEDEKLQEVWLGKFFSGHDFAQTNLQNTYPKRVSGILSIVKEMVISDPPGRLRDPVTLAEGENRDEVLQRGGELLLALLWQNQVEEATKSEIPLTAGEKIQQLLDQRQDPVGSLLAGQNQEQKGHLHKAFAEADRVTASSH